MLQAAFGVLAVMDASDDANVEFIAGESAGASQAQCWVFTL